MRIIYNLIAIVPLIFIITLLNLDVIWTISLCLAIGWLMIFLDLKNRVIENEKNK